MQIEKQPFLCGGVFFFLLIQATLPGEKARDHKAGKKDSHAAPILMQDLIYTFTGSRNYGAAKDTSQYRECEIEGSINVPFNDIAVSTAFDSAVKSKSPDPLKRMSEFVNWHLNMEMKDWLVKALLEIIENDDTIPEDETFYIKAKGTPISKHEMRMTTEFSFQPFLLGVLHFILVKRREQNRFGKDTLEALGTKKPRKERRYTGTAGESLAQPITVTLYDVTVISQQDSTLEENPLSKIQSDSRTITDSMGRTLSIFADSFERATHQIAEQIRQDNKKTDPPEDEPESADAEVVDDKQPSGAAEPSEEKIIHQTVVNQYGDHPIHINHVENLKL